MALCPRPELQLWSECNKEPRWSFPRVQVASSDLEFGRATLRLHLEERLGEQGPDRPRRAEMQPPSSAPEDMALSPLCPRLLTGPVFPELASLPWVSSSLRHWTQEDPCPYQCVALRGPRGCCDLGRSFPGCVRIERKDVLSILVPRRWKPLDMTVTVRSRASRDSPVPAFCLPPPHWLLLLNTVGHLSARSLCL